MSIKIEQSNLAKFIFSIIIIFYHICFWGYGLSKNWLKFICQVGMFGFLFLSGYGLTVSYYKNGLCNYWEKKFKKIYIPAVIANILAATILLVLHKIKYDRGNIFIEIFMLNRVPAVNSELWFLRLLLVWYILFFILYNYVHEYKKRIILMGAVTLLMCYMIPETYGLANLYSMSFPIGVFYAEIQRHSRISHRFVTIMKRTLFAVAFVGTIIFMNYVDYNGIIFNKTINFYVFMLIANIVFGCSALVIIEICGMLIKHSEILSDYTTTLGDMSLMIYILQRPFVLDPMIWSNGIVMKNICMSVGICLIILISYVYRKYCNYRIYKSGIGEKG